MKKMDISLKNLAFFIFISIFVSIMATYPIQVLFKKVNISITAYVMFISISTYLIFVLKKKILLFDKKLILLILLLISAFFISFLFNIEHLSFYNTYTFTKYISYSVWLLMIFSLKEYIYVDEKKKLVKIILLFLGTINFLAVIAQSFLRRLPDSIDIKPWNLVGDYIRAGSVYADSNFLAIYLVILFYSILAFIRQKSYSRNIVLFLLFIAILLTFSRGALVFFLFSFFVYNYQILTNKKSKRNFLLLTFLLGLIGISAILNMELVMFERFTSKIGGDAAYARIRQYTFLLEHIIEFPEVIFSGLGPGVFQSLYIEEVHNYFFSLFSEIGIIGPLLIIGLIIYFNKINNNIALGSLLLFWLLEALNLPALPNALFIIFVLIIVANKHPYIMGRK